jgi:glycosidase
MTIKITIVIKDNHMFIFDSHSEFFRSPQGGIKTGGEIALKIYVKRSFTLYPELLIEKRHDYAVKTHKRISMEWIGAKNCLDLYRAVFTLEEAGNYYYSFIIGENKSSYNQILVYDDFTTPDWIKGGIIYHIFVDRFYKDMTLLKDDDIKVRNDWGGTPEYLPDEKGEIRNNDFFGGNLEGIKEKLPYLKDLGVTVIYLSPVFEAHSNHKYDTGDYLTIDPMFGNEESLKELCTEASKSGMNIILDGVFSHTGSDSIYFNKNGRYKSLGAYQSKLSPYYSWYMFNNWYEDYLCWWNIKTLPAVNKENKDYIDFITGENGVLNYWQECGVKGWRLDVADELPDSFLNNLRKCVKKNDKEAYIVGEVWEDASDKFSYGRLKQYFLGKQLDSVTNYPLRNAIINFIQTKDCSELYMTMNMIIEKYPPQSVNCLMNILGTHDTARILTVVGSSTVPENKSEMAEHNLTDDELAEGINLLKIAVLLQMTLPGIPCIYYGDEAGMQGWTDPFNRRCFPWGQENQEILSHYNFLGELRKSSSVFSQGKYRCLVHDKGMFAFERYNDEERLIIAANISPSTVTLNLKQDMKEYGKQDFKRSFNIKSNEYLILMSKYY